MVINRCIVGIAWVKNMNSPDENKGGVHSERQALARAIMAKKRELARLVSSKQSLQDEEVYRMSCELDRLVVEYMKKR